MDLRDEIARVAYELYEKSGMIEGRDLENWLEAERIVMAQYGEEKQTEEDPIEASTAEETEEMLVEPSPLAKKTPSEEPKSEATKKRTATKRTTKKAEAKKEETKKTTRAKKTM